MAIVRVYDAIEAENPFEVYPELTEELLLEVLQKAEAIRAESTGLDAPMRAGSEAFFEKVRGLRVGLVPHGWSFSNDDNYCTVISPDGRHQIAVAAGTRGTGQVNGEPETARGMGPVTAAMVGVNCVQLDLFDTISTEAPHILTWLFLSYREVRRGGDRIHSELSLPEAQTESGIICTWRQRFVLTPWDMAPDPFADHGDSGGGGGGAPRSVDVPVSLKR